MQILCAFDRISLSDKGNAETSSSVPEKTEIQPLEIESSICFPQSPKITYEVQSECCKPEHALREKSYLSTFSRR